MPPAAGLLTLPPLWVGQPGLLSGMLLHARINLLPWEVIGLAPIDCNRWFSPLWYSSLWGTNVMGSAASSLQAMWPAGCWWFCLQLAGILSPHCLLVFSWQYYWKAILSIHFSGSGYQLRGQHITIGLPDICLESCIPLIGLPLTLFCSSRNKSNIQFLSHSSSPRISSALAPAHPHPSFSSPIFYVLAYEVTCCIYHPIYVLSLSGNSGLGDPSLSVY